MKKIIYLLALLLVIFSTVYTKETDIEEILFKQWDFLVRNENVYYGKQRVPNLDYMSFKKLNAYYLKDRNGIYAVEPTIVVTGWATLEDDENFNNENWYEDKVTDQWFSVEMKAGLISQIGTDNYVLDGQYIFGNGYAVNRREVIHLGKNAAFKVDMGTLRIIDTGLLKCADNDFRCLYSRNMLLKDKNGVYVIVDGYDEVSEVYKMKSVDIPSFEKTGAHLYKDKNRAYTLEDLYKKAVRMKRN